MSRRSSQPPQSLKDLVPQVLQQTKRSESLQRIQDEWARVVGHVLAEHSRPVSLRKGRLYVQTDEAGTNFLLSLKKQRLLARLPKVAGCEIADVVIRTGAMR